MVKPRFYRVTISAERMGNLGHSKRDRFFLVPGINEADAVAQVRTWIMLALGHQGPVLMRHVILDARYCEPTFVELQHQGLEKFNPNDWLRFIPDEVGFENPEPTQPVQSDH